MNKQYAIIAMLCTKGSIEVEAENGNIYMYWHHGDTDTEVLGIGSTLLKAAENLYEMVNAVLAESGKSL